MAQPRFHGDSSAGNGACSAFPPAPAAGAAKPRELLVRSWVSRAPARPNAKPLCVLQGHLQRQEWQQLARLGDHGAEVPVSKSRLIPGNVS